MKNSSREPEYLETCYEQEVGMKAFRSIVLKTLLEIEGVYFLDEGLVDSLLGEEDGDGVRGIEVKQQVDQPSIEVKIQISLASGISIPQKIDEIQAKVVKQLTLDTGLHVSRVQVIIDDVKLPEGWVKRLQERLISAMVPRELR